LEAIRSLLNPSQVLSPPSGSVFARRPSKPLLKYLFAAILLTLSALFLSYGEEWLSYLGYTLSGFVAPLVYLIWMMKNDRYEREPLTLIAFTFGWGAFCGIFAALLNILVAVPLLGTPGAALVEEPLKLLGVYWLAKHSKLGAELNDHLDGMIYGAAAGAGFAGLENLYYITEMVFSGGSPPIIAIAIRSAASFNHIAWSAMAGRSLGLAKALRGHTRISDLVPGLLIAIPFHFMWNSFSPVITLFVLLPYTVSVLFRQVSAAQRDEARWGFVASAPIE
jgi:RsiW-degrading membrane proteinase PrsW (M82 family)